MELTGYDVRAFLAEDVGDGDVTAEAVVPVDARLDATILLKEDGIVCGLEVAEAVLRELDPSLLFERLADDGDRVRGEIARVSGGARALLTGERTALNLLGRLSGIATLTRQYVDAVAGTGTLILDTRNFKTDLTVKNGQTLVLGGIIQRQLSDTIRKVPILGSIPGLGWAFKKKDKTSHEVELMVFLRPKVVRTPEEAQELLDEVDKRAPLIRKWQNCRLMPSPAASVAIHT